MGQWGEDGPRDKWLVAHPTSRSSTVRAHGGLVKRPWPCLVINGKNSPCPAALGPFSPFTTAADADPMRTYVENKLLQGCELVHLCSPLAHPVSTLPR